MSTTRPPAGDELAHGMWSKVVRDGEEDYVAVEEPLEIRVDGAPLAVTMRTPGHDDELALGDAFSGIHDGLLVLQFLGIVAELREALFPKALVLADPSGSPRERLGIEAHRAELGGLAARDEPRPFQHFQMCRDGGLTGRERRHELVHGCLALGEPRQDRPPGRICQSCENQVQLSHK